MVRAVSVWPLGVEQLVVASRAVGVSDFHLVLTDLVCMWFTLNSGQLPMMALAILYSSSSPVSAMAVVCLVMY